MHTATTPTGIAYDVFGDGPDTVVLVMGLGVQRLSWHASFCELLASAGHRVIRLDNRDVGTSKRFDALGAPSLPRLVGAWMLKRRLHPPYELTDLADDVAGVLDHVGADAAHVVGVSMGGMISQIFATRHAERTRTLTSLMSTTGRASVSRPGPKGVSILLRRPQEGRDAFIAHTIRLARDLCNGAEGFDEAYVRAIAEHAWPGRPTTAGVRRHLGASIAAGDRTRACAAIAVPTLVIHGRRDPLFPVAAAEHLAATIPGAQLEIFEDLGHAFMPRHWPRIAELVIDLAARG
jgi:pimeloyl-ACP methyl ester carboxylesterase